MPICFSLSSDGQSLLIRVWDASLSLPTLRNGDLEVDNGRGLLIVQELSAACGSYRLHDAGGKIVWAWLRVKPLNGGAVML